ATLGRDGFALQNSTLFSASSGARSFTRTFSSKREGQLRFALVFRNEGGAKLGLTLESPAGKKYPWEGNSTVLLEVPGAPAGHWRYVVRALQTPYENFPFRVLLGEQR